LDSRLVHTAVKLVDTVVKLGSTVVEMETGMASLVGAFVLVSALVLCAVPLVSASTLMSSLVSLVRLDFVLPVVAILAFAA
jgi:hypothetical protein